MAKAFFILILLAALTGCAATPISPLQQSWQQREAYLQNLTDWQLQGRIGIRTADDSWSGSLRWQQQQDHYDIGFSGPLGQGAVKLQGDQDRVVLSTPEGDVVGHQGPEQLLRKQLGWQVPLSHLRYWVVGRPSPQWPGAKLSFDEFGRISQLQQDGWTIDYRRYQRLEDMELPSKVVVQNSTLTVKLVVDQWQVMSTLNMPN